MCLVFCATAGGTAGDRVNEAYYDTLGSPCRILTSVAPKTKAPASRAPVFFVFTIIAVIIIVTVIISMMMRMIHGHCEGVPSVSHEASTLRLNPVVCQDLFSGGDHTCACLLLYVADDALSFVAVLCTSPLYFFPDCCRSWVIHLPYDSSS